MTDADHSTDPAGISDEGPGLFGDLPAAAPAGAYRVLARKYRPTSFADLIGQDALVRTLSNAFSTGRIAQAYILTGVRGVGKTTTARILARGLNYQLPDGSGGPTVDMPVEGVHCRAILESRHVDVLEMDAASNTGIGDIREIIESARYKPISARTKVYIIDEVHMLSTAAFNGLLKTLEEPPEHVKFIFATTEIRKVPVTVLSRCQRFDLRRVEGEVLVNHLARICAAEKVEVETDALALIARAAEGSVRDSLSLLDQAIAHGTAAGRIGAEDVRTMLGLADRTRVIDLFEALMRGDMAKALGEFRDQYDIGADPAVILADLAEFVHLVTRIKVAPALAEDRAMAEEERRRARDFASLSMRVLSRAWQMLLKGISEVQGASRPAAAAEMVLVRIAYAADLPTPEDAIKALGDGSPAAPASPRPSLPTGGGGGASALAVAPRVVARAEPVAQPIASSDVPARAIGRFEELVALAEEKRDVIARGWLERHARLVAFEDGRLEVALAPGAPHDLAGGLGARLSQWTGRRWVVVISSQEGQPTLYEAQQERKADALRGVRADPYVQAVLERFPGAEIVRVEPHAEDVMIEAPVEDGDSDET